MSCRPVNRWLFGKLPTMGDFVSRGLDQEFRDSLDHWLSQEMADAHSAFADFNERYEHAPAWNFVDCDPQGCWSGGALCASIDRVGRHFPMIMAVQAEDAGEATALSGACLAALHEAFMSGWDADGLYCAELSPVELPWSPSGSEWALVSEDGPEYVAAERFPEGILSVMLEMAQ